MKLNKIFLLLTCCGFASCISNSQQNTLNSNNRVEFEKAANFLNTSFTNEDKILFSSLEDVIQSFQELSNVHFEKSLELSKKVLFTPGLTPEIYKFSLKSYSLAKLVLIDQSFSQFNKHKTEAANYNFTDFQNDECNDLCNSIGWSILVQNTPDIFTPEGTSKYIITKEFLNNFNINLKNLKATNLVYSFSPTNSAIPLVTPKDDNLNRQNFSTTPQDISINTEKINALNLFINGKFQDSIKIFMSMKEKSTNSDFISMCYYWIARNYSGLNNFDASKKYFNLSGSTNPLNLYDALSGQMLKTPSGRTSTLQLSPFVGSWENEEKKWISYPNIDIFNPNYIKETFNINVEFIKKTIKTSIFLLFMIKEDKTEVNQITKVNFLADNINWLKLIWPQNMESCCSNNLSNYISSSITWLIYSTGNFLGASFFANQVKDYINLSGETNNFLYFVFYPLPYKNEFTSISKKYEIDRDILYAIYRQDSLFFNKPTETDLSESAHKIKTLLIKYNNNLVYTLAAYNAGSDMVDKWLKKSPKFRDDVLFVEFIPNKNNKTFVVNILRNYYNIKWIYSDKEPEKWWENMLFIVEK